MDVDNPAAQFARLSLLWPKKSGLCRNRMMLPSLRRRCLP